MPLYLDCIVLLLSQNLRRFLTHVKRTSYILRQREYITRSTIFVYSQFTSKYLCRKTFYTFHFEEYWTLLAGYQEVIASAWNSVEEADLFRRFMRRMQATAHKLTSRSVRSVGNVRDQLAISRELLLCFDATQEHMTLSPNQALLGLTSLERLTTCAYQVPQGWRREHVVVSPSVHLSQAEEHVSLPHGRWRRAL